MPHTFLLLSDAYLLAIAGWVACGIVALVVCLRLRRKWRHKPRPRTMVHAALSIWFFLATVTTIEILFALTYDQTDSFNLTNASRRWEQLHVRTNSAGYRDARELPRQRTGGVRHVAFIGDSFTFGQGIRDVADRFSDRVAADLERRRPGEFHVSNLGRPAADIQAVRNTLDYELDQGVEFDVVIYVYCLNDVDQLDDRKDEYFSGVVRNQPQSFLFRETYFLNLLYFRTLQFTQPEVRDYFSFLTESYVGPPWERMVRELDQLRALCARRRIDLRVVVFPFLHNLGEDYPFGEAHDKVVGYCAEHRIPVLDLLSDMNRHSGETLTVSRFDAHPNERAHQLAAEAITTELLHDLTDPPDESSR